MEERKQLASAIVKVMEAVRGLEKRSRVGAGKDAYSGTKDSDVKEVFNTEMAAAGLCILPIGIEEETHVNRWEESTQYGPKQKQTVFTKVKTKYLLLHTSGESLEIVGYGHGMDTQDKSAGKATTYALKNALLYTFLTPTLKIDDADATHSDEYPVPPAKKPAPKEPVDKRPIIKRLDENGEFNKNYLIVLQRAKDAGKTLAEIKEHFKLDPADEENITMDLINN